MPAPVSPQDEDLRRTLLDRLGRLEHLARTSRWQRLFRHPGRYLLAMFWQWIGFPVTRVGLPVHRSTFFGHSLSVLLPAGTDIFLLGGKGHDSEVRLARYLVRHLHPGDRFLDIGAHVGYFSALASRLAGPAGRVLAVEATPQTFAVLHLNLSGLPGCEARHLALSDAPGEVTFYAFPVRYSEYNSMDISPYAGEDWFAKYPPEEVPVEAGTLDQLVPDFRPDLIKIDVEGAEAMVISGGRVALSGHPCPVVMEYLDAGSSSGGHARAHRLLLDLGFRAHGIDATGEPFGIGDPEAHLRSVRLTSDNLVYLPVSAAGNSSTTV